jgi:hypothetical protein
MDQVAIQDRHVKTAQEDINLFWGTFFNKITPDGAGSTGTKKAERAKLLDYVQKSEGAGSVWRDKEGATWSELVRLGAGKSACYGIKIRHDGLEASVDQLLPNPDGSYDLAMVKAMVKPKDYHYMRMAFQKHVLEQSGLKVRSCHFWMLNPCYGDGESPLMVKQNVSGAVQVAEKKLPDLLKSMRGAVANPKTPPTENYCAALHEPTMPKNHIFRLTQGKKKAQIAYARGIRDLADWPADIELSPTQEVQVKAAQSKRLQVNRHEMDRFLSSLQYPIHFLDFETANSPVPLYDKVAPYTTIPFMFANYKCEKPGAPLTPDVFIAEPGQDPRRALLGALKESTKGHGSIIVFSKAAESTALTNLAKEFPEEKEWLDKANGSLVDLYAPFRSFHFHHPDQSSNSLKGLLSVFAGVKYDKLLIRDGAMAEEAWIALNTERDPVKIATTVEGLKVYCCQDSSGMGIVLDYVQKSVNADSSNSLLATPALMQAKGMPEIKVPEVMAARKSGLQDLADALDRGDIPTF